MECSATTRRGAPCRVRPRPGRDRCPFHDSDCAAAFTAGRRKGGSRPKPRPEPPLDPQRAGVLLARLFAAALDAPEALDTPRLEALAALAPFLLAAADRTTLASHLRQCLPAALPAAGTETSPQQAQQQAPHARQQG
jgi:hypothetical protein